MLWISLALLSAFLQSVRTAMEKQMDHKVGPFALLWASAVIGMPLYIYFASRDGFAVTSNWFWLISFVASLGGVISHGIYVSAVQRFDISKVMPITVLSPLLILLGEVIFLGTYPTLLGFLGMIILVIGALYFFWDSEDEHSPLDVIKNLVHEKDSMQMFLAIVLMAGLGVIDKLGITMSSPGMYLMTAYSMYIGMLCGYFFFYPQRLLPIFQHPIFVGGAGTFNAMIMMAQVTAMKYTLVANVIAVKRIAVLFTILYGYWFFGETQIGHRLKAALVMIGGVLLITLYG